MSVISDYLIKLERQYPKTQAVSEQIEELRDTLHIKTEEYQSQGMSYNEAAKAAIASLGDVVPLLDEISGNMKKVYINKLNKNNAISCTLFIIAEFLLTWFIFIISVDRPYFIINFFYILLLIILAVCIWPITTIIQFHKQPNKIGLVEMQFKKLIWSSVIGWLIISFILISANIWFVRTVHPWFIWPVIGIFAWPVNVFLYHRQLLGGRYDAA